MNPVEIAKMLQTYGGWALSALLIVGIIYLYWSSKKSEEKRSDQFVELLRDCSALLGIIGKSSPKVEEAMRENNILQEDVKRVLDRIERHLDKK